MDIGCAQNNYIISRIKLIVHCIDFALIYLHKTNVAIETLLAFVMIGVYIIRLLINPAAAFGVCDLGLHLVVTDIG